MAGRDGRDGKRERRHGAAPGLTPRRSPAVGGRILGTCCARDCLQSVAAGQAPLAAAARASVSGNLPTGKSDISGRSILPALGTLAGRLLVPDVGNDREADEQRILVGIVVREVDAHRQALHDLDEVARRILRGQEREGRAGPHREARDRRRGTSCVGRTCRLPDRPRWPIRRLPQLRLLEIGVDPDFGQRADGHQALAGLHVIAGVDVSPRDHAVDLGHDVAVAQVQFGLIEIALGLIAFRHGQLDVGRLLDELGVNSIQVAVRVSLVKVGDGLFGRRVVRRRKDAQRRRAGHQFRESLSDAWSNSGRDRAALASKSSAFSGFAGSPSPTRI